MFWCIDCEKGAKKQDKEIDEFLSFMTNEQKETMNKIITQRVEQKSCDIYDDKIINDLNKYISSCQNLCIIKDHEMVKRFYFYKDKRESIISSCSNSKESEEA